MSTGINPFFMTHGYNTPLLDYDIAAADGTEDRGARTPLGNKERNNQETLGGLRFRLSGYRVRIGYTIAVRKPAPSTCRALKGWRPCVVKFKEYNHR